MREPKRQYVNAIPKPALAASLNPLARNLEVQNLHKLDIELNIKLTESIIPHKPKASILNLLATIIAKPTATTKR